MKKFTRTLTFTFFPLFAFAQHQLDNWYFGDHAGLSFVSGSPVALIDGQTNTVEGTSSMSDSLGNLLFYTDGVKVWDKNHVVMINGTGLHGGESSTQSALIIKLPLSDSLYYIFTTGQEGDHGLEYSIADMSLQGGDGDVILKNVSLLNSSAEKVTCVRQPNGIDYWVLTHGIPNNKYYAYSFTSSGVNVTPVISQVGEDENQEIGYMKASHNGKKIGTVDHLEFFVELCDFDNATGEVSNPLKMIPTTTTAGPYGLEFSPNDSIIYVSAYTTPCVVMQWDISSNDSAQIVDSRIDVAFPNTTFIGALQLASDGKIYLARYLESYLGVINNPNIYGMGCDYVDLGVSLDGKLSEEGLPNADPSLFKPVELLPVAQFSTTDTMACDSTCVDFFDLSINNPVSWQWSFPGATPSSSSDENPENVCYTVPGSYDVTLIVSNDAGTDTITISNFITINNSPLATITTNGNILTSSLASSYQWSFDGQIIPGATDQSLTVFQSGTYSVTVADASGCSGSEEIFFSVTSFNVSDTTLCEKFCIDFSDQSQNDPVAWQWFFEGGNPSSSTEQNPSSVCYDDPGNFDVTLITTGSNGTSDTLTMENFITVFENPFAPVITQNGNVLTSSAALTYQWQLNGIDIPGATDQSYTIVESGLYTVIITNQNGCTAQSSFDAMLVGIEELTTTMINLFPNPSNGNFALQVSNAPFDRLDIEITNALGVNVFSSSENISSSQWKKDIHLTQVVTGIYFLHLQTNGCSLDRRVIIME